MSAGKTPTRFWLQSVCQFAVIAVLAWRPAQLFGTALDLLMGHPGAKMLSSPLSLSSTLFGFCVTALLLIVAVVVPGELLGFLRPYARSSAAAPQLQVSYRKLLLVTTAVLGWIAIIALVVMITLIRSLWFGR